MRKLLTIMLTLMMMTCVAFADEESPEPANADASVTGTESVEAEGKDAESAETESAETESTEAERVEVKAADAEAPTEDPPAEDPPAADPPAADPPAAMDMKKVKMSLSKTKFYKTGSAIKPVPVLKYAGKKVSKKDYKLKYSNNVKVGTATVTAVFKEGSKSVKFKIVPAKPGRAPIKSVKSVKPSVRITWKKVDCTAYKLQLSASSDFSKSTVYWRSANTTRIGELKNGKTYYFRVRAYNKENGKTTYGNWSVYKCKVNTTGPVGNKYSLNGKLVRDRTIKVGKHYFYYNTAGVKSGCAKEMWDKVKNTKSKTKYLIAVDCTKNRTCIYTGEKGKWKLKHYWMCTTGAKGTPTIKGSFNVCGKVPHFGEARGYTCWHATRIKYEYYFHSVLYRPYSKTNYIDKRLGKNLSHGCIRLAKNNALWIYNHCKNGTKIVIY